MKKILVALLAGLLLPSLAFAAFNDVTITSDASLTVNSATVNVSGSSIVIESIIVDTTTFTVGLKSGSTFAVSAPGLNMLTVDVSGAGVGLIQTCNANTSSLELTPTGASTVIVSVSSTLCGASSSSSSGGGGGPVGLIGTTNPSPTAQSLTPVNGLTVGQVQSILDLLSSFGAGQTIIENVRAALYGSPTSGSASTSFTRNLELGMTGADVKALQVWLNANGYTVASSGPGSSGNETTKFGNATKAALIKFQKAKGITPAVGYFGPKTRAAIGK